MNKQKNVSQLLIRARGVQQMAKETVRLCEGTRRTEAKALQKDAKKVAKAAFINVAAQARLTSLGMDNIDLPNDTVHQEVVVLEIRLEHLIGALVRSKMASVVDQGEHEEAQVQRVGPPVFHGRCEWCDRAVGGWLGAGLGLFGSARPTCIYCMGQKITAGQKSPGLATTLVLDLLRSGNCWACNVDIDGEIGEHHCVDDDCGYDAVSVGQRRFCSYCAEKMIPTAGLSDIVRQVLDSCHTLEYVA